MTEIDLLRKAVAMHSEKIKQLQDDLAKAFRLIEQLHQGRK